MTTTGANLRRVTEWVVGLSSVLFLCIYSSDAQRHSETVSRAYVGSNGAVRVVRADGREVVIPKEKEQQGAEELQISDNHKTLGWLVEYPNCCTSYPIPMTVVLYRDGTSATRFIQILHLSVCSSTSELEGQWKIGGVTKAHCQHGQRYLL